MGSCSGKSFIKYTKRRGIRTELLVTHERTEITAEGQLFTITNFQLSIRKCSVQVTAAGV